MYMQELEVLLHYNIIESMMRLKRPKMALKPRSKRVRNLDCTARRNA